MFKIISRNMCNIEESYQTTFQTYSLDYSNLADDETSLLSNSPMHQNPIGCIQSISLAKVLPILSRLSDSILKIGKSWTNRQMLIHFKTIIQHVSHQSCPEF